MGQNFSLVTKNAFAIEFISRYFISTEEGSKILTISQFEELIPVARGTIQNSIKILTESKAVTIQSRGKLGSFLTAKDSKILLKYAGINFLVGVMPLPYSKIYEGLSTGLLQTMENKLNIPVNMAYMRGAERRIEMILNQRYDFAIISKFAASRYLLEHDDITIIQEFEHGSFLSGHVLMFSDPKFTQITDGMKIGIDRASIDQSYLTQEVCKDKDVEFVEVSYTQLTEKLALKEIDATVWNGDEVDSTMKNIHFVDLDLKDNDNTKAVVIISSERLELKTVLNDMIDISEVEDIQRKVLDGRMIPSY